MVKKLVLAIGVLLLVIGAAAYDMWVSAPEMHLDIGMKADLVASAGQKGAPGTVRFSGKPRCVQGEGTFFLDDILIDDLQLTGFPPQYADVVKLHGPTVMRLALERQPIDTIQGDSMKMQLAKYALRKVEVADGKVRITFKRPGG